MATSKEEERNFVVKMYGSEYRQIQAWVAKQQHIETGGDLFGLWADDHTAVVQLVLGPGKNCRRTATSFYQDIDYLQRVGNVLTSKEGLCHIGEWHSHHRMGLTKPSGGDENTVWTNMDRYSIHRFFLLIATIEGDGSHVAVRCFPFETDTVTKQRKKVLEGKIDLISKNDEKSPFRTDSNKANFLEIGAESVNSMEDLKKLEKSGSTSRKQKKAQSKKGTKRKKGKTSKR